MTAPPLIDVTGARRRRSRQRLKRRLTIAGVVVAVLALVAGGAWLIGWSSVFSTDTVSTQGLSALTEDEVVRAAAVPLGTPLARLDTGAIEERVAVLPAVASVTVRMRPPHTVLIDVTERSVALVVGSSGAYRWVDAEGIAFHTSEEVPPGVLKARANLSDADLLASLATVADALPPAVTKQVELMTADTPDSITLQLTDNRRVIWGSADESAFKAEVLVPLLTVDAKVYNVSAPAHPTTR